MSSAARTASHVELQLALGMDVIPIIAVVIRSSPMIGMLHPSPSQNVIHCFRHNPDNQAHANAAHDR
jgi:hypothetical protein